MMETEIIDITLCIGLFGVCVISIVGDEYDIVYGGIEEQGVEEWYDNLPEHTKPIEGIYTIKCKLTSGACYFSYKLLESKEAA